MAAERFTTEWYIEDAKRIERERRERGEASYDDDLARIKANIDPETMAVFDAMGWPDLVPLTATRKVPRFPTIALPQWESVYVDALAEATQTPVDLAALLVLCCTAAAAGGRAVVEVRPGWREPLNLYGCCAMVPGSRKSAVFAKTTEPLIDVEQTMAEIAKSEITEASTRRAIAEKEAANATFAAARADPDERDALERAATTAALLAESITVPTMPRLVADDATPEAIGSLLAAQGGRLAVMSPEGDVFEVMAGRYTQQVPNVSMFLKAHAGDVVKIDRKSRAPEYVKNPALTIAATVQPSVLESLTRNNGFRGRGLLARFLWSVPESNMGSRRINPESIPGDIETQYVAKMQALVRSLAEWTDPAVLVLTTEAHEIVIDLETELEPRLGPSGDLAHIADWAGKYVGAVMRIAGLIHLASNLEIGWSQPITADTMQRARGIGKYFMAHALIAFDLMGADPNRLKATKVGRWLTGKNMVSRRDVHRAFQSDFARVDDVDPVLSLLEDHGWLRRLPDPPRSPKGGRPPAPTYVVNPAVNT